MTKGDLMSGIDKILVSREEIGKKVKELGKRISEDYKGQDLLLVGVLKGAVIFMADLLREITIPVEVDMISVSSYENGTDSTGIVKIVKDLDVNIKNRHVLIVEDLIDTGLTLQHLKELLATREPLSVKVCTIFDKPTRRLVDVPIEYNGIAIPNYFVIGYGLDYAGEYRNLPDLCTMKQK